MKYLSHYTEKPLTDLFNKYGAFFAFGEDQFERAKDPSLTKDDYIGLFSGLICPKANRRALLEEYIAIIDRCIKEDIAENTLEGIIKRELNNHEAYYTGDITDTVEALEAYNITADQVMEVYRNKNYKLVTA